jgi:hypothetical protein
MRSAVSILRERVQEKMGALKKVFDKGTPDNIVKGFH